MYIKTDYLLGVDAASDMVSQYVRVVGMSELYSSELQHCPVCLIDLDHTSNVVVALVRCNHKMHLECLNEMLRRQQESSLKVIFYFVSQHACCNTQI